MTGSPPSSNNCVRCGDGLLDSHEGLCPRCLMAEAMQPTQADNHAAPMPILTPEELAPHFPQLEIISCLGRGGMGVVYKARQKSLNRLVALKLLAPERAGDPQFATRFEKEAHALAALNHPHIVGVYDFGQAGGFYFLLMEFVDGVNLRQAMKAGRFSPEQALAVVPPVCEALQYAHEHGIVHRDIKPENLLLDKEGRVKIADFGIAKMLDRDATDHPLDPRLASFPASEGTLASVAGTPQYMSPEQKAHGVTDHRADIYSLGVVLYEMLTGELPADKLQPPSRKVQIDVRLDEIVLRALEKTPELRYQTAGEFRTQVETMVGSLPAAEKPAPFAEPVSPRGTWLPYVGLVAMLAGSYLTYIAWHDPVEGRTMRPAGVIVAVVGLFLMLKGLLQAVGVRRLDSALPKAAESPLRTDNVGNQPSRFSRKAIVAACWAPLFFVFFVLYFTQSGAVSAGGHHEHLLWLKLTAGVLGGLGFTAPFGTTILGWVAAGQIRRSAGKLCGLGLAVFDGLFFPLLALTGLIGWVWHWVFYDLIRTPIIEGRHELSALERLLVTNATALTVLATLVTVLIVGLIIIRRVWRAVNPTLAGEQPAGAPAALRPKNRTALAVGFGVMVIVMFGTYKLFNHARVSPSEARAKIERVLEQEITKQLTARSERFKMMTVALDPELKTAAVILDGLQEMRGIEGRNVWVGIEGSLKIKNNGGDWLVEGDGALGAIKFTVPLRDLTDNAQAYSSGIAEQRSRFPLAAPIIRNAGMVLVHHDNVDLHYALFAKQALSTDTYDSSNTNSLTWQDHGFFKVTEQQTFGYHRESTNPYFLELNGKQHDLRKGRVFVLHDDGLVEQLKLFPPLATAKSPEELAKLTDDARTMSGEPVTVEKMRWQLQAAGAQLKDALKTMAPTHPFVVEVRESIETLEKKIEEQSDASSPAHFGPIEQCFIATGKAKQSFYSIERNAYVEAPWSLPQIPRFADQSAEAKTALDQYAKWLADNDVDFLIQPAQGNENALALADMLARPVLEEQFTDTVPKLMDAFKDNLAANHRLPLMPLLLNIDSRLGTLPTTIFKTRKGRIGILQVVSVSDNPRGVNVRYKLVRGGATKAAIAKPASADATPAFGPEIERTLNDPNETLKDSLISLDSGTLWTLPDHLLTRLQSEKPEQDQLDTAVMDQWLRVPDQRFDALARLTLQDGKVTQFGLRTFQLLAVAIEPEQAEQITPDQAVAKIDQRLHETAFIGRINDLMADTGKPVAYIFKTVQGQIGILQIIGLSENPRGVKICIKLVQDSAGNNAPAFGPVTERELALPAENSLPPVWLDLDRGKEIPTAGFTGDYDEPPGVFAAWLKQLGVDLALGYFETADTVNEQGQSPLDKGTPFYEHGLFTWDALGLSAMPVKSELWDEVDAKALLAMNPALAAQADSAQTRKLVPDGQTPENPKGKLPATFLFKTAEGNLGLVQILDFTEGMRSVKIRYKLVQSGALKTVTASNQVSGRLVDYRNNPVAGATILVPSISEGGRIYISSGKIEEPSQADIIKGIRTTADADGRFTLTLTPESARLLLVTTPAFLAWIVPAIEPGKETLIALPPPASFVIRYDVPGGPESARFDICLNPAETPGWKDKLYNASTSISIRNGQQATVGNLPPGVYDIQRRKDAGNVGVPLDWPNRFVLAAGESKSADFTRKGERVRGSVADLRDFGLLTALIQVTEKLPESGSPTTAPRQFDVIATGPDGTFETEALPPGNYTFRASATLPEPETIGSRSSMGRVFSGRLDVSLPSAQPAKGYTIQLTPDGIDAKLWRQRGQSSAASNSVAQTYSFGPVIERVVNDPHEFDDAKSLLLDIADWEKMPAAEMAARIAGSEKIDIRSNANAKPYVDLSVALAALIADGKPMTPLPHSLIWGFTKPNGGAGILQVTGFTANPRGVKVRYKLLQTVPATPATQNPDANPVSPADKNRVGTLGYGLGTYLTIGGVRAEADKVGTQTLLVDTIGGNKLDQPIGIWIENVELPKGERCVLKGYETGRMIGTPDEVLRATGALQPQAKWQFHSYFIATSVEQPGNLKLSSEAPSPLPVTDPTSFNQLQDAQTRWAEAIKAQEQTLKEMAVLAEKKDLSATERETQERKIKLKLHDLESEIIRIRALIQQHSPPPWTPVAPDTSEASELKGQKYVETFRAPLELVEATGCADGTSMSFVFKDSQSHKLELVMGRADAVVPPKGLYNRLHVGSIRSQDAFLAASGGKTEKLVLSLLKEWLVQHGPAEPGDHEPNAAEMARREKAEEQRKLVQQVWEILQKRNSTARLQFRLIADDNDAEAETVTRRYAEGQSRVSREVLLDETSLSSATVVENESGRNVWVTFNDEGAKKFVALIFAKAGKKLAIVFDHELIAEPTINNGMNDFGKECRLLITCSFSAAEAERLAATITTAIRVAAAKNKPEVVAENASFRAYGSVIVRELKPCVSPDFPALNLDAGFMLHCDYSPPEVLNFADPDMRGWRETSGADLVLRRSPDGNEYQLRAYMRIHPIPSQSWEKEFEKDIDMKFSSDDRDAHELTFSKTAEPATYAFRTRNDTCGVLQLLGTGPDSNGVKIRYKLSRFVERPEPVEWQQLRTVASTSPVGSKEWLDAQFNIANWLPRPYLDQTLKILEDIRSRAQGDTLVLAKVESALVSYYAGNRELDVAEQHCRTLIDSVLKLNDASPNGAGSKLEAAVRMDLTSQMLGTADFMIHQLSVAAPASSVPVAQRIKRIKSLANDHAGLQAIQRDADEAMTRLGAAENSLGHPAPAPESKASGTLNLAPTTNGQQPAAAKSKQPTNETR